MELAITTDSVSADNLIAGDYPIVTEGVTIANGQDVPRGAVLGKVTASGEYVLSLSAAADGSQTPVAILAEDVDATSGAKAAIIYKSGEFNQDALTLGASHTIASIKDGLRDLNIYLKSVVPPTAS